MFSANAEKVQYGADHYEWKTQVSTIMNQLFEKYDIEGVPMPYTMEDYQRDVKQKVLKSLSKEDIDNILNDLKPEDRLRGMRPEERLRGMRPEDRLRGMRPEEVFKRFRPEDRLKGLRPEDRLRGLRTEDRLRGLRPEEVFKRFRPEDRLKDLTPEEIEAYLKTVR